MKAVQFLTMTFLVCFLILEISGDSSENGDCCESYTCTQCSFQDQDNPPLIHIGQRSSQEGICSCILQRSRSGGGSTDRFKAALECCNQPQPKKTSSCEEDVQCELSCITNSRGTEMCVCGFDYGGGQNVQCSNEADCRNFACAPVCYKQGNNTEGSYRCIASAAPRDDERNSGDVNNTIECADDKVCLEYMTCGSKCVKAYGGTGFCGCVQQRPTGDEFSKIKSS